MFDMFRFPYAIIYAFRKRGMRDAVAKAIAYATRPVAHDDAAAWVRYVISSPIYQKHSEDE